MRKRTGIGALLLVVLGGCLAVAGIRKTAPLCTEKQAAAILDAMYAEALRELAKLERDLRERQVSKDSQLVLVTHDMSHTDSRRTIAVDGLKGSA